MSAERFFAKARIVGECWEWPHSVNEDGYGRCTFGGKTGILVHRLAYTLTHGEIPDGLVVDHRCRNRRCYNPAHLEAVTNRVNVMRGTSFAVENAQKTQCDRGHEFTPENTRLHQYRTHTKRICRECDRLRQQEMRDRRKARRAA